MGPVAGALDGCDQRFAARPAGVEADVRRLGREIDRRASAGDPIQRLFNPRRARGAGHAFERQVDLCGGAGRRGIECCSRIHARTIYPHEVYVNLPGTGILARGQNGILPARMSRNIAQSPMKLYTG